MARLPSGNYLMQQIGDRVVLFREYTKEEIVSFDPRDGVSMASAQGEIMRSGVLNEQDKAYAHFWSGYFYAHVVHSAVVYFQPGV